MSGQMRWTRDAAGMGHPDDSVLLAYTRRQSLADDGPIIHKHLDHCEQCRHRCQEYEQVSEGLRQTLSHFQHYPPLTENVLAFIENPDAARLARRQREQERRQRLLSSAAKRKFALSLRLVPLAAVVLLLIAFVSIGLAHPSSWIFTHQDGQNRLTDGIGTPSVNNLLPHSTTPTAKPTSSPAVPGQPIATVTATATATSAAELTPTLKLCSDSSQTQWLIHFCGYNFTPGDKVQLVASTPSNGSRSTHAVIVNTDGKFEYSWLITNCKNYPLTVQTRDLTHSAEDTLPLQVNQQNQCSAATPLPQ